jgi:hypothetical protein
MPFPTTREELIATGYAYIRTTKCMGPTCGAHIEWWVTPKGKRIPLNLRTYEPHWSTCPDRELFRNGRKRC